MKIVDQQGRTPEEHIKQVLRHVLSVLQSKSGRTMQSAVKATVQRHFERIYPGSKHYDPKKVSEGYTGPDSSTTKINVPGVTRAYHNMDIRPVKARKLTIPVHREALLFNSAREVPDLFYAKNKKGTEMLARIEAGALVVMYILKDQVHQKKDSRLMPSDKTLADNIFARMKPLIDRAVATA